MRKRRGTTVGPRGSGGLRAAAARRGPACRRDRQRSGSRGRGATLEVRAAEAVAPFPPLTNRPVCERHGPTGEPAAGKPHGGFGERGEETWPRWRLRHRHDGESRRQQRLPPTYRRRASPRLYTSERARARSLSRRNLGKFRVNAQKQIIFHHTRSDLVRTSG